MSLQSRIVAILLGSEPKLRRMLSYWAATGVLYTVFIGLLWVQVVFGATSRDAVLALSVVGTGGLLVFYGLIRASVALGLTPWRLAFYQAQFAIACNVAAYAVVGPIRAALLMTLLVVFVFCAFSLRPRETKQLSVFAIVALSAVIAWLVNLDPQNFPLYVEVTHLAIAASSLVAVAVLTNELSKLHLRLKRQKDDLIEAVDTIRTLATVDELTSLATRRHMHEVLSEEERRQATLGQPICMALLDIDFFKNVNDRYGHAGGDAVLRTFAGSASSELRAADVLARWGGEEFLLLLPDTELPEAVMVLDRIAKRICAMRFPEVDPALRITFSGGVVARLTREPFADAIRRADEAMYRAKRGGRDRIVAA
jgi:diguanylate cyclase